MKILEFLGSKKVEQPTNLTENTPGNGVAFVDQRQQHHQQELTTKVAAHTTQAGVPYSTEQATPPQEQPVLKTVGHAGVEQFSYEIEEKQFLAQQPLAENKPSGIPLQGTVATLAGVVKNELDDLEGKQHFYETKAKPFYGALQGRVTSIVAERNKRKKAA